LGGIYAGIMTPTEAGAIAAAYVFLITGLVYRELKLRTVLDSLGQTVWLTGQIFIIIAASGVFSRALSLMQVPQALAETLSGISPLVFFIVFNLLFLLLGMFLDPASAVLVTTPLIVPTALSLGINLIHLGLVMVVNLAIGMFTPPVGLNLFVAQSIFSKSMKEVVVSCLPFLICYLLALIVITYVPELYMWLPPLLLGT
jgi:C4-dicarboxylate transporter DctM subunit